MCLLSLGDYRGLLKAPDRKIQFDLQQSKHPFSFDDVQYEVCFLCPGITALRQIAIKQI